MILFRTQIRSASAVPLLLGLLSLTVSLYMAFHTFGTNDVVMWETSAEKAVRVTPVEMYTDRIALYAEGKFLYEEIFNHPPLMIFVLRGLYRLSRATALPFNVLIRAITSLFAFGVFLITWSLLPFDLERRTVVASLVAVCPVMWLVAGFHGNSDPVMIFFCLLGLLAYRATGSPTLLGLCIGLATGVKLTPVFLIPVCFFYLRSWPERLRFSAAAGAIILVPWLPVLLVYPSAIRTSVKYGGGEGNWGIGYLMGTMRGSMAFYYRSKYILAALITAIAWWVNRAMPSRVPLFFQCGLILHLFLFFASGFAIQYLAWVAPWVAVLGWRQTALQYFTHGLFVFLVYNFWSDGLPWNFANSVTHGTWRQFEAIQLLAWATTGLSIYLYMRKLRALTYIPI